MIKTVSKVRVVNVKPHTYKSNFNQAELRQSVTREYGAGTVGNDMQSAFAPKESYNLPNNAYQSERVCWVDIPKEWDLAKATAHIEKVLASGTNPCIYQVLSFDPILTSDDHSFMQNKGFAEKEQFLSTKRNNQLLINPSTGEVISRSGKSVYRKLFYSEYQREDVDLAIVRQVSAIETVDTLPAFNGVVRNHHTADTLSTVEAAMEF